ncbi:hypothetical protein K438DRAFT_1532978, partial [Mycena galopus ATCC 62051]
ILSKLLCFTNLTHIDLCPPVGFDIDDAMAWDIARAWPRAERLNLTAATDVRHPPRVTLLGLNAFATHCPELRFLTITFDASIVPPFGDNSAETIRAQLSLEYLDATRSPIIDSSAVARFLIALFPNLSSI